MTKRTIFMVAAALVLATGGLLLCWLVIRPALEPEFILAPAPKPAIPTERNSVLNLFLNAPTDLPGNISRIELTVSEAMLVVGEQEVAVYGGSERVMVHHGTVQVVLSERIPHGKYESLKLAFSPVVRVVGEDGSLSNVLLPDGELNIDLSDVEVPVGRTLNILIGWPADFSFGERNGMATLELPDSIASETHVLGGAFLRPRDIGELLSIPNASIRDVIKSNFGLEIAGPDSKGSSGFAPATTSPEDN